MVCHFVLVIVNIFFIENHFCSRDKMHEQGLRCANKVRLLLPSRFLYFILLVAFRELILLKRIDANYLRLGFEIT